MNYTHNFFSGSHSRPSSPPLTGSSTSVRVCRSSALPAVEDPDSGKNVLCAPRRYAINRVATTLRFICCILLLCAASLTAHAQSGTTGNLEWSIADGTLTISGNGEMPNYGDPYQVPWYTYSNIIYVVEIQHGVTSIGACAFYGCSSLKSVTIPESMASIGSYAFYGCSSLETVIIPESVASIGA